MSSSAVHIVVLAAGQGTRMKSRLPKVLHRVPGGALLDCVIRTAESLTPETLTIVIGHGADAIRSHLRGRETVQFVLQEPQLGTAHALMQTAPILVSRTGTLVLLSGDVPLLRADTLRSLLTIHCGASAAATVLTATVERPFGYGRIVRVDGEVARIVEERDASPAERQIREINSGIYAFDMAPLFEALGGIATQNAQGEYYLTDLIAIYRRRKLLVKSAQVDDPGEVRGINSRTELAEVSRLVRQKKNEELMASGVTLVDPAATYVDPDVEIGADTVIHPGVVIEGRTRVGAACEIHAARHHRRHGNRRQGDHQEFLRHHGRAHRRRRDGRSVRAPSSGNCRRRRSQDRQLRRVEKDHARRPLESQPPFVPRRRDDRHQRQRRRWNDHVQLRRRTQARDDHRGRRVHRQRLAIDRARASGEGGLRGGRLVDYAGCSLRSPRHRARTTVGHRGVGRAEEGHRQQ